MSASFLPQDYQAPATSGGQYTKLQPGENRVRILSNPAIGWLYWNTDGKPVRLRLSEKPQVTPADMRSVSASGQPEKIKHFWAVKAYNYATQQMEVMEITQSTIMAAIQSLTQDEEWGHPKLYDLKIVKSGTGMNTEYAVKPAPAKPVSQEIKAAFAETPIDLEALFDAGNPFSSAPASPALAQTSAAMNAPRPASKPKPVAQAPKPAPVREPEPVPVDDSDLPF